MAGRKAPVKQQTTSVASATLLVAQEPPLAAPLRVRVGAHSDVGRVRSNNEDRLLVFDLGTAQPANMAGDAACGLEPPGILLMVADGMGGMQAGERASQMCVDLFPASLLKHHGGKASSNETVLREALAQALVDTHRAIYEEGVSNGLKGMGTTLTAMLLRGSRACIVQVGDSRAYLGRAGAVTQMTRDQTVWESMLAKEPQDSEAVQKHNDPDSPFLHAPWKNMLMQALGAQVDLQVDVKAHDLEAGDWLLLCSDGLYRVVLPEDMAAAFQGPSTPAEKAQQLVALANQRGGPDNVSVIVAQVVKAN